MFLESRFKTHYWLAGPEGRLRSKWEQQIRKDVIEKE
jgi:hypothetical protein